MTRGINKILRTPRLLSILDMGIKARNNPKTTCLISLRYDDPVADLGALLGATIQRIAQSDSMYIIQFNAKRNARNTVRERPE
jgi:hypothetical protein